MYQLSTNGWRESVHMKLGTVGRVARLQSGANTNDCVRIAEVRHYGGVEDMVEDLGAQLLPDAADADARVKVYQELYADEDHRSRGFVAMRIEWPAQSREVNGPIGDNEDDGDDEDDDADSVLTFSISSLARPSSSSSSFSEDDELIGCDQLEFQPVQEDELSGCNSKPFYGIAEQASLPAPWQLILSSGGEGHYYYNPRTGVSQWRRPTG